VANPLFLPPLLRGGFFIHFSPGSKNPPTLLAHVSPPPYYRMEFSTLDFPVKTASCVTSMNENPSQLHRRRFSPPPNPALFLLDEEANPQPIFNAKKRPSSRQPSLFFFPSTPLSFFDLPQSSPPSDGEFDPMNFFFKVSEYTSFMCFSLIRDTKKSERRSLFLAPRLTLTPFLHSFLIHLYRTYLETEFVDFLLQVSEAQAQSLLFTLSTISRTSVCAH